MSTAERQLQETWQCASCRGGRTLLVDVTVLRDGVRVKEQWCAHCVVRSA